MSGAAPTVLLAEDSADDRFLIARAIGKAAPGVALQLAVDGVEAVDYLAASGRFADRERYPVPRLLLLDWKLSRRSGEEVLRWIRAQPRLDALPVVVLTMSAEDGDIRRAYAARANSYLQKPGASAELVERMQATLGYWLGHNLAPSPAGATPRDTPAHGAAPAATDRPR